VHKATRSGQPKPRRTGANEDRVRTLVPLDQRLGVRLTAEELNMNRKIVRQNITNDLAIRKLSAKMVPRILSTRNNVGFTFQIIFYTM
jgi:hypothetical protein